MDRLHGIAGALATRRGLCVGQARMQGAGRLGEQWASRVCVVQSEGSGLTSVSFTPPPPPPPRAVTAVTRRRWGFAGPVRASWNRILPAQISSSEHSRRFGGSGVKKIDLLLTFQFFVAILKTTMFFF